jgi:hypothetical protein
MGLRQSCNGGVESPRPGHLEVQGVEAYESMIHHYFPADVHSTSRDPTSWGEQDSCLLAAPCGS